MTKPAYTPDVFFAVDAEQAAVEVLRAIGRMDTGDLRQRDIAFRTIEKESAKIARSVESYRRAKAAGRDRMPREEYDALHEGVSA